MIFRPKNYLFVLVGASLLIALIAYLVERYAGHDIQSAGSSFVPMLVAAMLEGQHYAKSAGSAPAKSEMWRGACQMTGIAMLMSIVWGGLIAGMSPDFRILMGDLPILYWVGAIIIGALVSLLFNRLGFGLGIKNELKVQARARKQDK